MHQSDVLDGVRCRKNIAHACGRKQTLATDCTEILDAPEREYVFEGNYQYMSSQNPLQQSDEAVSYQFVSLGLSLGRILVDPLIEWTEMASWTPEDSLVSEIPLL